MYVTTCGDSLFLKPKLQKMPEMVGYGAEPPALQAAEGLSFSSHAAKPNSLRPWTSSTAKTLCSSSATEHCAAAMTSTRFWNLMENSASGRNLC